jgi:hypothetical protein
MAEINRARPNTPRAILRRGNKDFWDEVYADINDVLWVGALLQLGGLQHGHASQRNLAHGRQMAAARRAHGAGYQITNLIVFSSLIVKRGIAEKSRR